MNVASPMGTRTAAVIALLSASGTLPMLRPPLPWSGKIRKRAKELEEATGVPPP